MKLLTKTPLRIGFAGGGTDVDPFCSKYGGAVVNATINLFSSCLIEAESGDEICIKKSDLKNVIRTPLAEFPRQVAQKCLVEIALDTLVTKFEKIEYFPHTITTFSDAPPGTGLGSSSALVVSVVSSYLDWFGYSLDKFEIAKLAFQIERLEARLTGGRQDQYSAVFGGFNLFSFGKDYSATRTEIVLTESSVSKLENCCLLYFTGVSRKSSVIIHEQAKNVETQHSEAVNATKELKTQALDLYRSLAENTVNLDFIVEIILRGWASKKKIASNITNLEIDNLLDIATNHGALAAKVTGAGGGGCILFLCNETTKPILEASLRQENGRTIPFRFTNAGCQSWRVC